MKKLILFFGLGLAFNAYGINDWLDCGKDALGYTANCQYKIDTDGTLTIRGTGNSGNIGYWLYHDKDEIVQPWKGQGVTNVIIEDSIKDLGTLGFANIASENPIIIPSSVTQIRRYALDGVNVSEVIIPNSVTSIEEAAFAWSAIQKIDIPVSVKTIENSAFRAMTGLTDLIVPDSVEKIGSNALSYCSNLKILTIGENTQLGKIFTGFDGDGVFTDIANLKIYCTGDTAKCDANLAAAGYPELKTSKATTKQINGVTYVYDKNGKLVTSSGHRTEKRIYTIDEANAVAGDKNRVSIKYR
ncbi:MAG: leucine-rich repeat domain-containing protein [Alphaproteobacteria bacterium]|nr:leucine-rich repeat domain-containing protein [Alphaproteobacteria bacterium]